MKNTSTNPFYASAKVERGDARLRLFKALRGEACEVVVRSDGHEEIDILLGNKSETALTYVTLDIQEAKEFANMILGVVAAIERKGGCSATDSAL